MGKLKMKIGKLFHDVGTPVEVWDIARKPEKPEFLGLPVSDTNKPTDNSWIEGLEPEKRYEPVLPYSSTYQKYATAFLPKAGGSEEINNLSFYSEKYYGMGTVIYAPELSSAKYTIVSHGNYSKIGGYYVYQLRGDSQHPNG